ncbi:hypothetical protein AB833_25205 [Chromatiales bacterium (ex Bugula neritina AB1)]|nr:hypothetical protein AB833_25205 [Chromatiales bacterium (ex Bugula neritina AB1)]
MYYDDASDNLYIASLVGNDVFTWDGVALTGWVPGVGGNPFGVVLDGAGNVFYSATNDHVVYKIVGGSHEILAGTTGAGGSTGDGGSAMSALLNGAQYLAVSGDRPYISDTVNNKTRVVNGVANPSALDTDLNGIDDSFDNCPLDYNPSQGDFGR